MGFDNECILNIQSLAGEYFCPVCRLLVYPNEALQSQCTHLYCKPCLTYVVNTTRACPYDGYLVTEADSKLLIESNKTLAETIGKVAVHCLYHRSGCIWQGSLSECVGHCSGCAFGNSPVVCNRCGIQIVHRQVQEHAQTCQGVQPQAQHVQGSQGNSATTMEAAANYSQSAGIATSLTQTSQPVSSTPDPKQQVGSSLQGQAAVPTPEQWYQQQQQQYQQYYQQYPGYDLQQQNYQQYYPYQQPAGLQYEPPQNPQVQPQAYVQTQLQSQPQSHPQAQSQTQLQPQSQSLPQPSLHSQAPTHIQTPAAAQPQNQGLVNAPQQLYPAMQPVPSQMQSQPHPANHIHPNPQPQSYPQAQPQQQPVPMTQYQQPQPQMQHPPAQIQQQGNSQFHAHQPPAAQSQAHSQAQAHYHPHALIPQHNQPLNSNVHSQMQNPPVHGVTGHHSYPHSQAHQQTHLGASQNPIQMQGQFPQQLPISRPPLSHATYASQQQLPWLPSAGVVQNASAIQQQSAPAHAQHPAQHVNQRPVMQAVQCPPLQQQHPFGQQGQFLQQQLPIPSQLRSQGPSGSFPKHPNGHPHMQQQNIASIQQNQPQNSVGKHMIPNHGAQSHPYPQSRAGGQVRTVHHHANQPPANQGNSLLINNRVVNPEQQASESSSQKASKKVEGNLDAISGQGADGGVINILKIEADPPLDNKNNSTAGGENGKPLTKQIGVKEEAAESTFESSNGSKLGEVKAEDKKDFSSIEPKQMKQLGNENKEIQDGSLPKNAQPQGTELSEDQSKELQKDLGGVLPPPTGSDDGSQVISTTSGSILGSPHDAKRKLLSQHGSDSSGFVQHSHWPPPHYNGPPTLQQRPIGTSTLQGPPIGSLHHVQMPGNPSVQFMPPASGPVTHPGQPLHPLGGMPEPGSAASFGRGPGHYGPPPQGFGQQLLAQGSHGQGQAPTSHGASKMSQGDPVGGQPFATAPPGVFDSHGQMIVTGTPHEGHTAVQCPIHPREVEMFPHQRPGPPHVSGVHANTMKMNGAQGPDPSLAFGLRNDRLNPFPADPARRPFNRSEFEDNLKKFPRPSLMEAETIPKVGSYSLSSLDRGVRGPTYDTGLNPDSFSGYASSRIFAPLQMGGPFHPADVERPLGFRDDAAARSGPVLSNPDFRGLGPGYGRHLMDGFGTRSPHDYHENAPRRFGEHPGISGLDEIDGRGFHRFGDPPVNSFQESRFSIFSSSLHRTDFEGPGNWRMGEHMRSGDFIGQDRNFGPRNLPGRLHIGEGAGYGAHTSHGRVGELAGLGSIDQFGGGNRSSHPRLGEPGFRSSFYLRGFPDGGRVYTGDRDSFDNSRKKKSASMGWCRICKVDCETVEGLDLHSQTKEHQKMAMDIVQSIKQNAKKQKLTSNDNSSLEDPSKSKDVDIEGHGKKE